MEKNTCLIIGNGKSLNDVPKEFLDSFPTFGANRIYLKYMPTYYVCVNPTVCSEYEEEILDVTYKAKRSYITHKFPFRHDKIAPLYSIGVPTFSRSPEEFIWEGGTVTYVSMQIAYSMGFEVVYLVGLDHYFNCKGNPNELQVMEGDDPNHFDPNYFKGKKWNLPDLEMSETAYGIARKVYEMDGRKIYNLSTDTALSDDIIERRSLWRTMEQMKQLGQFVQS